MSRGPMTTKYGYLVAEESDIQLKNGGLLTIDLDVPGNERQERLLWISVMCTSSHADVTSTWP